MQNKRIYKFIPGLTIDGGIEQKTILGGKGAGLCELAKIGVAVPPGFVITTDTCLDYYANNRCLPQDLLDSVKSSLKEVEMAMGKTFGSGPDPLLVSCRSGARVSMPGMMDTVLNIGFNKKVLDALCLKYGQHFAYDCYRRFLHMYGTTVLGIPETAFRKCRGATTNELIETARDYESICGNLIPEDPLEQLLCAIASVFDSWWNERAQIYRRTYDIPENWGTAASVVAMVYGNKDSTSGTGVVFTRNPATGDCQIYGEYLAQAQGEDVVRGAVTPEKIENLLKINAPLYAEIKQTCLKLEEYFKDVQDIEFTVESGKLWILQTRSAKRTAQAAVKIAKDFYTQGFDATESLKLVRAEDLEQFLSPCFDLELRKKATSAGRGIAASPGAACGMVVFSAADACAQKVAHPDKSFILVRPETVPDDIAGMKASAGFLTAVGGASSHAALVARQMGKPCIVGCTGLSFSFDETKNIIEANIFGKTLRAGDFISIDGQTGDIFCEQIPTKTPDPSNAEQFNAFNWLMETTDKYRNLGIWTNSDTGEQCKFARKLGAEGVGLCRTEHQFFDAVSDFQAALFGDGSLRENAYKRLKIKQIKDFLDIFKEMAGLPVTIRLLDPPLHEFLPKENAIKKTSDETGISEIHLKEAVHRLHESNPMLGFRGCRLGIIKKELTRLQIEAIFEAAEQANQLGLEPKPHIMVPLAGSHKELQLIYNQVHEIAGTKKIVYQVGAMIELPRACIVADKIAEISDFISFGTNDLTQTALGLSRDDCASFLEDYLKLGIFVKDPFQSLDLDGVGVLVEMAVLKARKVKPNIKIGICGEHGGDPESIKFFKGLGLDYVSCSPKRIPTAKLASIL